MLFNSNNLCPIYKRAETIKDYSVLDGRTTLAERGLTIIHPMYNNPLKGSLEEKRLEIQIDNWIRYSRFVRDNIKIIIVDDGSPVSISSILTRPSFAKRINFNLDIWKIKQDLLYNTAGAINLGVVMADTEWVLFMDSDCMFDPDTIERLLRIKLPDIEHWNYRFPRKRITKDAELIKNTKYLPCSMLIRKDTVMALHGFDEDFTGEYSGGYGFFDNHFNHKLIKAKYTAYTLTEYTITEYMHDVVGRINRDHDSQHLINKRLFRSKQRNETPNTGMLRFDYKKDFSHIETPSKYTNITTTEELEKHGDFIRELNRYRGWIHPKEGLLLFNDVNDNKYKTCYESGTRRGWSAAWMALGGAEVHTWDIVACCERLEYKTSLESRINRHIISFDKGVISFLENRPNSPVLFHIDGDHSYEGVKADFEAIVANLRAGDSVWFNDTVSFKNTVGVYVTELASNPKYNVVFFPTKYGMARLNIR